MQTSQELFDGLLFSSAARLGCAELCIQHRVWLWSSLGFREWLHGPCPTIGARARGQSSQAQRWPRSGTQTGLCTSPCCQQHLWEPSCDLEIHPSSPHAGPRMYTHFLLLEEKRKGSTFKKKSEHTREVLNGRAQCVRRRARILLLLPPVKGRLPESQPETAPERLPERRQAELCPSITTPRAAGGIGCLPPPPPFQLRTNVFSSLLPSFYLRLLPVLRFCLSLGVTAPLWYPARTAPGSTASSRSLQAPGLREQ